MVAELIADAINGIARNGSGCIYKGDYCITWASGHLLTLKEPEDYDPNLKKWDLGTLPIFFENWDVKPIQSTAQGKDTTARLNTIKSLMDESECIIHAGDPDDEGQLLIDEIIRYYHYRKPVYRMMTNDTTDAALRKALANVTDNRVSESSGWAAYARRVSDMTFGINLSRYFSICNAPARLTVGRVQTPTLALVVAREEQIENHVKTLYYTVNVTLNVNGQTISCRYEPDKDDPNLTDGKILDRAYAEYIASQLRSATFNNVVVTAKEVKEAPPLPFNLVHLQSYCGKQFGYSPSETLEFSQQLRDQYNAITYNRTSCQYLSDNHFDEAPDTMSTVVQNIRYRPGRMDMSIRSKCFDSSKIEAHHGIIPQNIQVDLSTMVEPLRNLYLAICKFYMVQFMPPAVKKKSRLEVALQDGGKLVSTSTLVLDEGYLALFKKRGAEDASQDEDTELTSLSALTPGTYFGTVADVGIQENETRPPTRYTQVTLNEDMTRISKYVKDPEIKKLLLDKDKDKKNENGSIGTDATRSGIIKDLITRGFMEEKGKSKHLSPTPLGKELIRILPDEAKKPDITGLWWAIQDDITHGDATPEDLTHNVLELVERIVHTQYPHIDPSVVPQKDTQKVFNREILGTCPWCGCPVIEMKDGKGYSCIGWKEGCTFKIWASYQKNRLFQNVHFTKANVKALLSGKTVNMSNLLNKDGKPFTAGVKLRSGPPSAYGAEFDLVFSHGKKNRKKS